MSGKIKGASYEDSAFCGCDKLEEFIMPDTQVPHSIIAFGYPDEEPDVKAPEWEADRVHYEKW